ncbi:sulfurtransferase [Cohnella mopanensis]|uniref:sulfurtransferase n=1 Tax=Cohnella mopanensis TaxID=2911966 RepID=UPI001EF8D1B8|nr:sulfurtransferase [Cohnella mopanensis]
MTDTKVNAYPNGHLLADLEWVENNLDSHDLVLLDARAQGYEVSHIPGAIPVNVKDLRAKTRSDFAAAEDIRRLLEKWGISADSAVVVYDDGAGVAATRVFYVLEVFGLKDRVKVLNGGYTAWTAAGKPTSSEVHTRRPASISVVANVLGSVNKFNIQAGLHQAILLDVRSGEEYSGLDKRSNRKGGRIPGAVNKEWKEALGPVDEKGVIRFKKYEDLKKEFEAAGVSQKHTIVPYCQSNQRGAHTYFALRLIGYPDVRPYEGSWEEWGNAEDTEVES